MKGCRFVIGVGLAAGVLLSGCTTTEQGAATGAVTGAVIGHLISPDDGRGALAGALIGGAIGTHAGAQEERIQQQNARLSAIEAQANTQVVWITNSNGSRTPVTLRRGQADTWIGPKGEIYQGLPSETQLKPIYGF